MDATLLTILGSAFAMVSGGVLTALGFYVRRTYAQTDQRIKDIESDAILAATVIRKSNGELGAGMAKVTARLTSIEITVKAVDERNALVVETILSRFEILENNAVTRRELALHIKTIELGQTHLSKQMDDLTKHFTDSKTGKQNEGRET